MFPWLDIHLQWFLLGTDAAGNFLLIKGKRRLSQQGSEPSQISHWCLILSGPTRTCLRFICSTWSLQYKHTTSLLTRAHCVPLAQTDYWAKLACMRICSDGIFIDSLIHGWKLGRMINLFNISALGTPCTLHANILYVVLYMRTANVSY